MEGTWKGRTILVGTLLACLGCMLLGVHWLTASPDPGFQVYGAILIVWNAVNFAVMGRVSNWLWTGRA